MDLREDLPPRADNRAALARLRAAAGTPALEDVLERHGVRLLVAFGSTTRLGPGEPNDLDIAVSWEHEAQRDLVGLIDDLTDTFGPVDLDVMDLDRAGPLARANGLVGTPLYERTSGSFAEEQMAALSARMDTAWLRRLQLELLAQ